MPDTSPSPKQAICVSLATKIQLYAKEAAVGGRPVSADLEGLPEYANKLARALDRTTLFTLSREVDKWLTEIHSPAEGLLVAAKMRAAGVWEEHIPVLPSARKLRSIYERGTVNTKSEAELLECVFANPELGHLLEGVHAELGAALHKWQAARAKATEA